MRIVWPWQKRSEPPMERTTYRFSQQIQLIDDIFRRMRDEDSTPISRTQALSVPAVVRGRNLICSIATLPLQLYRRADNTTVPSALFQQFDPDIANSVHLAQTIEDLLFESIAWWKITSFDFDGFPLSVRRLDPCTVTIDPPRNLPYRSPAPLPSGFDPRNGVVYVDGVPTSGKELIRFDSTNPALLRVGARAIRRAVLLDQAAKLYAEVPSLQEYFTLDGTMQMDETEVQDHLQKWQNNRKKRATGFVPPGLEHHTVTGISPQQLQLVELQKQCATEIANLFGLESEDLNVSTTSRTYANIVDNRRERVNDVYAPYMLSVTDRLNIPGNVFPRTQIAKFYLDDYLKSNPTERASVQQTYLNMGVLDSDEIRADEGRPPRIRPAVPVVETEDANADV